MTKLKEIPIAPDYFINESGELFSNKTGRLKPIKPYVEDAGYGRVALRISGKYITKRLHQLVAITFLPNPDNLPQVNHIDCNKANNSVENLEWCTAKQNINHAFDNGLVSRKRGSESHMYGSRNRYSKKVKNIYTGKIYDTISEAAKDIGIPRTTLNASLTNRIPNNTGLRYLGDDKTNPDTFLVGRKITSYLILNTETGIFYGSITDAALSHSLNPSTLRGYITGERTNKSSFINA